MNEKRKKLLANLTEIKEIIKKASVNLDRTYKEVQVNDLSKVSSITEIEWEALKDIESLTARFARLSDIYSQKFLKLVDRLEGEIDGSIIDRFNRAEKRALIKSAQDFINIRDTRNDIAHEYVPEALLNIFRDVIEYTPILLKACNKALDYTSL